MEIKGIKKGISIIVCCYNSSRLLSQTLQHISKQRLHQNVLCEVILVDNASTDNTAQEARRIWREYNVSIPFKIIHEPKPGLTYAREAGSKEASYAYIIFCDDDNWLSSAYAQIAFEVMETYPEVALLGGEIEAAFEIEPPDWFQMLEWTYAVGKQAENSGDITETYGRICGAGMVIRKAVWHLLKAQDFQPLLSDRKGLSLSTGGDTELCWNIRLLGYRIYYDSRLKLTHFMTKGRLTWKYCRQLQRGIGESMAYLSIYEYVWNLRYNNLQVQPTVYWKMLIKKDMQKLFSSYKRLYFFFIKDKEGEFYICNYEHSFGRMIELLKIRSTYKLLIAKVERAFKV